MLYKKLMSFLILTFFNANIFAMEQDESQYYDYLIHFQQNQNAANNINLTSIEVSTDSPDSSSLYPNLSAIADIDKSKNNIDLLTIGCGLAATVTFISYYDDIKNGVKSFANKIKEICRNPKKIVNKRNAIAASAGCAICATGYYAGARAAFIASCLVACAYKYSGNKAKKNIAGEVQKNKMFKK